MSKDLAADKASDTDVRVTTPMTDPLSSSTKATDSSASSITCIDTFDQLTFEMTHQGSTLQQEKIASINVNEALVTICQQPSC